MSWKVTIFLSAKDNRARKINTMVDIWALIKMYFLMIFGVVLLVKAENYYFKEDVVVGEFFQVTAGRSQTICLRK